MRREAKTFNLKEFSGEDTISVFSSAMSCLRENPGSTLVVDPGIYVITSELARKTQKAVMAGDYGQNPERVMFNRNFAFTKGICFDGLSDITIEAPGAVLMVDGFMEVLSIQNCENITVKGLTIDHIRKPYTQGTITEQIGDDWIIELEQPVENGSPFTERYTFNTPDGEEILLNCEKRRLLDSLHVLAHIEPSSVCKKGLIFNTWHTFHYRPAILIENAKNVVLEDITIHSQPGMGIVGNRCHNVTLERLNVVPSEGQYLSTNTDATHFTSMTGDLVLKDCVFKRQGDDFVNVHVFFQIVEKALGDNTYIVRETTPGGTHAQSLDYFDEGDMLELTSYNTLQVKDTYKVLSCERDYDNWCCRIVLDHALPSDTEGLMLADITRLPYLTVTGCLAENHFARSVLVKTRGALIENNTFIHTRGPAVEVAAESWWYEGVCPSNVVIRGNKMINCGWRSDEASGILVKADAPEAAGQTIKNILIENNVIDAPGAQHGILCRNVEGLTIKNNTINVSGEEVYITDCENTEYIK